MAVYIDNKKYAILQTPKIKNQDITVTTNGNYYPSDEYTGFGLVRVKFPDPIYEEITVTPSIETQEILPSEGTDAISKVTVNPVTSDIDENIKPENIVKGTTILGVEGTFEFITETLEVSPSMKVQTFTPNEDVDGFSTVTIKAITSAIDEDIKPENIKKDVEILGVTAIVPSSPSFLYFV